MKTARESLLVDCKNPASFFFFQREFVHTFFFFFTILPSSLLQVSGEVTERTASPSATAAVAAALLGCDRSLRQTLRRTPGLLLLFNLSGH